MARFGFGYGTATRNRASSNAAFATGTIAHEGVTFTLASARPAGQYANGDWWVLGPVTINSISPASTVIDGTRSDGSAYSARAIHGTMLNPGNRSFAAGGLLANNAGSNPAVPIPQGFDGLTGSTPYASYSAANNVDPGRTGAPMTVTTGSVVKCLSATTPTQTSPIGRAAPLRFVVLTVVDQIPAADAIRPGVSSANKAAAVRVQDFDLSVFQNLAPVAGTPTFAEALSYVSGAFNTFMPDSINSANMMPQTAPEYGREAANRIHAALLCLHLNSFTAEQKRTLLMHIATFASDLVSRADEGALGFANGGGNQWKKPALVVATAALGSRAPANWVQACDGSRFPNATDVRQVWAEDAHYSAITDFDIAQPRLTSDGRPRTAFSYMALGSVDWGNWNDRRDAGMNWETLWYRLLYSPALIPGTQAVELTRGAVALWNNPQPFLYMKTQWHRRDAPLPDVTNRIQPFARAFMEAYRTIDPAAPQILASQVKDNNWFLRFDKALDELATAPAAGDFTVLVNGSPVPVSTVSVWRQAVGGTLAWALTGNDVVTISYTPTANRLRSVDAVNVAGFAGRVMVNRSDRVGGPNATYPVVRFSPGVVRQMGGDGRIYTADTQVGTFALLKFKFDAPPVGFAHIFGASGGTPAMFVYLVSNRTIDVRIQNGAGASVIRFNTPVLTAGVEYDILVSFDLSQANAAAGISCYINGALQTITGVTFTSGSSARWSVPNATLRVNHNGINGELGAFWLDPTTRVDLTNAATRAKFTSMTGGNLDILTRGDGITGSIPRIFLVGNDAQWNDGAGLNRGTGNKFFVNSGLMTNVGGSAWV